MSGSTFRQNGEDRAEYGAKLLQKLAERLDSRGFSFRNLKLFRQFYLEYPQLSESVKQYLIAQSNTLKLGDSIGQTPSAQFQVAGNQHIALSSDQIFNNLSFSHLTLLMAVKDPLKRTFYEMECIKSVWTHKELQRQIHSLYFERMGLSEKPEKLAELVQRKTFLQLLLTW